LLDNRLFNKRAEMLVSVNCDPAGVKHFDVISEDGWKSANKRVLRQMVATESESSKPDARAKSRITPDNYTFRLIEATTLEGRKSYVLQAVPKRQDKTLIRGRIWVDAEDYALARVEGEPAKNPSFWTRKVEFVQEYQKAGVFWFPLQTTSITDARVFGRTEVRISYFDYKPVSNKPSNSVDPAMMEAHYAKR
jgi:G:T-mismatch repair DNA endonuclease (very short patch repair protein)